MRTSRILRGTAAAVLLATLATPALADRGYHGGWGHRGGWGHHGHRYHGGHGSSDGWWIGGALALVATGLVLAAANDEPDYPPPATYSYSYAQPDTGFYYTAPPPATYPVPEGGYSPPAAIGTPAPQAAAPMPAPQQPAVPRPQAAPRTASSAPDQYQCQRYAVNYSGYDPASPSAWTTGVAVESYNRALQNCLSGGRQG